ncbi:hypothetical protein ACFPOD_04875 [Nitratireductor kimnyeongensis]|uniref:Uncharacterized protein n=1 Tax=Nitratireductor kimnyeongensis TaxID=430679 RepID=A0ABW0T7K5_9HYPH|nr:hypothetical protein [Nitratireductor kimnyeongensis]QZZ34582.1 hypothetical protein KW403_12320 [Nitratireductor kimnyeongensis]
MGFTPQQVNEMSVWQYLAAVDGYMAAHAGEQDGLSGSEVDELWEWMQEKD